MKQLNFFLDIDGTLIGGGDGKLVDKVVKRVSDGVISAILKAKEHGCRFFINTARPYWLVSQKEFPPEIFDGICSGCGTHITYHGEVIYQSFLSDEKVKQVITELNKAFPPEFSILIEGLSTNIYCGAAIQWYKNAGFEKFSSPDDIGTVFKDLKTQKLSFNKLSGEFSYDMFKGVSDDFDVMIHPNYAEIAPKGYNKGKAIMLVESRLGISHESTVAIGDSLNDSEMFKYAATSVAMGNAPDNVKALCDHVTDTVLNDGVAKAILKLIED